MFDPRRSRQLKVTTCTRFDQSYVQHEPFHLLCTVCISCVVMHPPAYESPPYSPRITSCPCMHPTRHPQTHSPASQTTAAFVDVTCSLEMHPYRLAFVRSTLRSTFFISLNRAPSILTPPFSSFQRNLCARRFFGKEGHTISIRTK